MMDAPLSLRTETLDRCPLCGGGRLLHLLDVPDHETHSGVYGIDVCIRCDLAFTNPRPLVDELPKLYDQRATADFAPGGEGIAGRLRAWRLDRYLAGLQRSAGTHSMHLLDFGCGDGSLALAARRAGFDVDAIDFHTVPPPALVAEASIRYRSVDTWRSQSQRYDLIALRHVLEHHQAPVELLRLLRSRLAPSGRVAIEVPNRRSFWAHVFGADFFAYYVPRHLSHFDSHSLARALTAAGFAQPQVTHGHTPLIGRSLGYRWRRNIDNLGLLGLASFPLQVIADVVAGESSTLHAVARVDA